MRTTNEIFSNAPSASTPTEAPASDSRANESTEESHKTTASETPAAVEARPKPTAKPEPQQQQAQAEHDDDEHEETPVDLSGFERALEAARGDKRRFRRQWREVEKAKQETERQLAELRGRLAATQQLQSQPRQEPQAPQPQPQIDLTEDEYYAQGPAAIKRYVEGIVTKTQQEAEQRFLYRSEMAARSRHEDFQGAIDAFQELAKTNPGYIAQMHQAPDPAEFVYSVGKEYSQVRGINSLDELREKIRAEERAKLQAEQQQPQQQVNTPSPAKPVIPKSLAGVRGTGVGIAPAWNGPRSTRDVFG